jgi:hypothetical protein
MGDVWPMVHGERAALVDHLGGLTSQLHRSGLLD